MDIREWSHRSKEQTVDDVGGRPVIRKKIQTFRRLAKKQGVRKPCVPLGGPT